MHKQNSLTPPITKTNLPVQTVQAINAPSIFHRLRFCGDTNLLFKSGIGVLFRFPVPTNGGEGLCFRNYAKSFSSYMPAVRQVWQQNNFNG